MLVSRLEILLRKFEAWHKCTKVACPGHCRQIPFDLVLKWPQFFASATANTQNTQCRVCLLMKLEIWQMLCFWPILQCCERDILALLVVMSWGWEVGGAGIAYQWELPTRHCCSYHQYPPVPTLWSSGCYYHNWWTFCSRSSQKAMVERKRVLIVDPICFKEGCLGLKYFLIRDWRTKKRETSR